MKLYLSKTLNGMAKGLFASLITGLIIKQVGVIFNISLLIHLGTITQYLMAPAIGCGVAMSLNAKQLPLICAIMSSSIGAGTILFSNNAYSLSIGDPMSAFIFSIISVEISSKILGKTKFDLLLIPLISILISGILGTFISPVITYIMSSIGNLINMLTTLMPIPMGLLLGISVGMILTLPISSAALCISIGISGLAAGSAVAGCSAQMIGFAVCSYRENKLNGLLTQGLGTSMVQVPNIIKNPYIWIPPTVASGIVGVLSSSVFKIKSSSIGAGMGTAGIVGQIDSYNTMNHSHIFEIILLQVILPVIISLPISELMRKKNLIKFGDMKL